MSCGSEFETQNCVCDTLLAIVEAQDKVSPISGPNGCERAIHELKCGKDNKKRYDTIPIILTNKCDGLPFIGIGSKKISGQLKYVYSPVFRVDDVDPDTCCASLELLSPRVLVADKDCPSPCAALAALTQPLTCSGVFITADLSMFGAVSCLSPIDLEVC